MNDAATIAAATVSPDDDEQRDRLLEVQTYAPTWDYPTAIQYIRTGSNREVFEAMLTKEQLAANAAEMSAVRVRRQLGYEHVSTLPKHDATIAKIAKLVEGCTMARPLCHVARGDVATLFELLDQLPATPEISDVRTYLENQNPKI